MSAPMLLHFGPTEIAHLAELQRTIPPAELDPVAAHWGGQSLSRYMNPLPSPAKPPGARKRTPAETEQLRSEYKEAIKTRGRFCGLFTGPAPFFLRPSSDEQECVEAVYLAQTAIDRGNTQIEYWTSGHENWASVYNGLVDWPSAAAGSAFVVGRPFIKLMTTRYCATLLWSYVKYVAARMAQACRHNPGNSSPIIWLGYAHWHSLDFFDQARVVLAAKSYEEYVHQVLANRTLGLSGELVEKPWHLTAAPLYALGHTPSLTSRQCRRSGVSQVELARRWA